MGKATAEKIIKGRPYSSVDDLAKAGVSKSTIGKISGLVTVGAAASGSMAKTSTTSSSAASHSHEPAASSSSSSSKMEKESAPEASKQAGPPPAKGMVWVNTATGVYHYEGDHWYGNTKEGKYMSEQDAIKAGYRASKQSPKQ